MFSFEFDLGKSRGSELKGGLEDLSQNTLDKRFFGHIFIRTEIPIKVHMILFV